MLITYLNAGYYLNIREDPSCDAGIIGSMLPGQVEEAEPAGKEWYELKRGGFVMAEFVAELERGGGRTAETRRNAAEKQEQPEDDATEEDSGELKKMTASALRKLAKDSGIKVPSNANKSELIAAILNG